jgi:hypothetical protein
LTATLKVCALARPGNKNNVEKMAAQIGSNSLKTERGISFSRREQAKGVAEAFNL